ncbi:MAG TPA: chemotaxis protein CheX [Steroidobacteraceae bacterium]|jgi:chemotaxis protein CheC|nr:chemotaxis protein CheX [Steroidobacteraceae bacterium]
MTPPAASILTEMELDALTELVNLGVSNAAHSLRELVREEILLSVPRVTIVTREEAIKNLGERDAKRLVGVHQDFDGDIAGRALLLFPETKSLELVRAIVGSDLSLDEIIELEQEALAETGNIILNACLATMANNLGRTLKISLPEVLHGGGTEFFYVKPPPYVDDNILFSYINFSVRQRNITGYIAMLLDLPSLAALKNLLAALIERTGNRAVAVPPNGN